jgi:photosystem II stability/assembly factor-like uncharacterized protein
MFKYLTAVLLLGLVGEAVLHAQSWSALGPQGGDVHSMAVDSAHPGRIFLGVADGHIFGSEDAGEHWALLGRASSRRDAVITSIVVDPRDPNVLFASSWTQDPAAGGGVFRSEDGGRTWRPSGLQGQAVRALVMAPSDADTLVAGTLDGVYRSRDAGKSWDRISPEHHEELRNFDSLAVDPRDPLIVYAGTFHLPWKTTDGGRTWHPIHDGMIDDSDVMSLLIDSKTPGLIYASACSGIYRSKSGAAQWEKIQGIPYTARRTYAITQDMNHPGSVFAATSEGLWKTSDAGMTWKRATPQNWVVTSVVVPEGRTGRVVIGTEQLGVLSSDDDGEHFHDANAGFFHRQILDIALDSARPGRVLAVLANSNEPILATEDDGKSWTPMGQGLRAEQVARVYAAPGGWWASLSHGGLMRYDAAGKSWQRAGLLSREAAAAPSRGSRPSSRKSQIATRQLDPIVNDMAFGSNGWYAATEAGLLMSADRGATWTLNPIGPLTTLPVQSVRVSSNGERLCVVSLRGLVFSTDGGKSRSWHDLPAAAGGALSLYSVPSEDNTLVAVAHNGLYISRDAGQTWREPGAGLPSAPVQSFAVAGSTFVASLRAGGLFASSDSGRTWARVTGTLADGLFSAVTAGSEGGDIYAASATDGLYEVQWSPSATDLLATSH